ncbi:Galactosyltransferase family protein [Actinidia rufa]|uniref:Hexosyltransferase n=1 Tax=Actinidia rufa TaxID=165716 RepID=A0A7J0EBH4_9ERIC|nr:Galactosyltransferase family protein [Actinidia rufa]
MEDQKGIIVRFVIGRSTNHGDSLDRGIDSENKQMNDFIILENHVEAPEELPKKTKLFFAHVSEKWDAEFYAKVNDDVYVNIDALGNTLAAHLDKPRAYIGCMKSGEVFSEQNGMNQIGGNLEIGKRTSVMTMLAAGHQELSVQVYDANCLKIMRRITQTPLRKVLKVAIMQHFLRVSWLELTQEHNHIRS